MRIHALSIGRRTANSVTRGFGWLAGFAIIQLIVLPQVVGAAETWTVSTKAEAHDKSGEDCGNICPGGTNIAMQSKIYPPDTLSVSVQPQLNTEDNGDQYVCNNIQQRWCQDSSRGVGSSSMGHKRWQAHHDSWAKAYHLNHGLAKVTSHADGILRVVWPLQADGTAVPNNTLQFHFKATGTLHAHCDVLAGLSATASTDIQITMNPFSRPAGTPGPEPPIPNQAMSWSVSCNAPDMVNGFDLIFPVPNGVVVGDRYAFTLDWITTSDAESSITDNSVAYASTAFLTTGDLESESSGDQTLAVDFDVPDPVALPACPLNVSYFRGACTAGTLGAPCNAASDCGAGGACDVTSTTADDQTVLNWPVSTSIADVYSGLIPSIGAGIWTLAPPTLALNDGACLVQNALGGTTGALDQGADPNPAVDTAVYYQVANNNPAGGSVNALGCASPSVCSNAGWCQLGGLAGNPCNVDADCAGGTCVIRRTACSTAAGGAEQGGCALHSVCVAGANPGTLCLQGSDCPGGTCPAIAPATVTPGQICYNQAPSGCEGCPPAGQPRVTRVLTGAVLCP